MGTAVVGIALAGIVALIIRKIRRTENQFNVVETVNTVEDIVTKDEE